MNGLVFLALLLMGGVGGYCLRRAFEPAEIAHLREVCESRRKRIADLKARLDRTRSHLRLAQPESNIIRIDSRLPSPRIGGSA